MEKLIVEISEPIRLDRYLRRLYPQITQGVIEKAIRVGQIKLNEKKTKASVRLSPEDVISLAPYLIQDNAPEVERKYKYSSNIVKLGKKILYEYLLYSSDEIIAIDKPNGLAVQGGSKINLSIDDALNYLNRTNGDSTNKEDFKLVHRLDKDTSGILLIAKGYENSAKIGEAFLNKLIEKTYIAVVEGCPQKLEGTISSYIGKEKSGIYEKVQELKEGGKLAQTNYKVLASNGKKSIVEYTPQTGRMHQLRFHSQQLGCPIIGDTKYGGKPYPRLLLHAQKLIIPKEILGKRIVIESELEEDFLNL